MAVLRKLFGNLGASGRADRKRWHFDVFRLNFVQQNVTIFFLVGRQRRPQTFRYFVLKQNESFVKVIITATIIICCYYYY